MSDWVLAENPNNTPKIQKSDWNVVAPSLNAQQPQNNESFGMAALKAPPRVAEDVYRQAMSAIKSLPGYYEQAKTEVPGVFSSIQEHPGRAAAQLGAGMTEMGHNLLNAPRGIADYIANRLNLLPKEYASKVPYQGDISSEINQLFGSPEYAGEKLIRGVGRNAINLLGGAEAASVLNPLKFTDKSLAKDVMRTREKNIENYSREYKNLWKDAEQKGFGDALYNIDIDMKALKKYSPGKSIEGVMEFNKNPTLENAHNAKSDLLRIQRDLMKLPTLRTAERRQLEAATNAIDNLKQNMFKDATGNYDQKMLDKYEKIQKGYANEVIPYKNKPINEFLRNELSEKELINALSKRAFARKRGEFHPRIKLKNKIKDHPYLTAAGLGGLGTLLYNDMMGNGSNE